MRASAVETGVQAAEPFEGKGVLTRDGRRVVRLHALLEFLFWHIGNARAAVSCALGDRHR